MAFDFCNRHRIRTRDVEHASCKSANVFTDAACAGVGVIKSRLRISAAAGSRERLYVNMQGRPRKTFGAYAVVIFNSDNRITGLFHFGADL